MGKKTKETPLFTAVGTIWAFGNQFQVAVEYEIEEFGAFTKNATLIGVYLPNQKFPTELNPPIPIDLYSDDIDRKRENEIEQIANIDLYKGKTEENTESSHEAE
jgi:hypothetical protein